MFGIPSKDGPRVLFPGRAQEGGGSTEGSTAVPGKHCQESSVLRLGPRLAQDCPVLGRGNIHRVGRSEDMIQTRAASAF